MKILVKVKRIEHPLASDSEKKYLVKMPVVLDKGDFIDLSSAETIRLTAPQSSTIKYKSIEGKKHGYYNVAFDEITYIPLGVAIKLPDGYYARVVARSSTPKGAGILCANSMGVIDGGPRGYNGNNDEWKFPALAIRDTTIEQGQRICQFEICLSQKATVWQKIKHLFCSGIEIVEVDDLGDNNRSGFGSTGK